MAASAAPEGDPWFERRHGGSRLWGDTGEGRNPFARRSSLEVDQDDFEDLKWAALQRLPTVQKQVLACLDTNLMMENRESGEGMESTAGRDGRAESEEGRRAPMDHYDIRKLNKFQRSKVVDTVFRTKEHNNEYLLREIEQRLNRSEFPGFNEDRSMCLMTLVGISLPTVEVRFNNLSVNAEIHVGSRALPTLPNFCRNLLGVSTVL
ncbi:hypothetical protein Mapa_017811 [Marchantia paleacea]|nr:hypothetical protein Mapa_017811 [Marchantia paleacea]